MSYAISWVDESHTTVHQQYESKVARSDFEGMVRDSNRMLLTVPHAVDIIIEWNGERHIIQDFTVIYDAMFAEKYVPTNQRFVFVINLPPLYRVLAGILQRSAPRALGAMYFVETLEDVYRLRDYLIEAEASPV